MTIDSNLSRVRYVGNGITTSFSIPFPYLTNNDGTAQLAIYVGDSDTPLKEGVDYTIVGLGQAVAINDDTVEYATYETRFDGGDVIFELAPEQGVPVAVVRNVPQTQGVVFVNGEKFPAHDFENALDKLTMEVQEVKENLQRAIVLPPTSTEKPIEIRDEILVVSKQAKETADEAVVLVNEAKDTIVEETQAAVNTVVNETQNAVNVVTQTTDKAVGDINNTAEQASEFVVENVEKARIWAEGEQSEVKPLGGELSSMGAADLAYAIANAPEDTPIDASGLFAMNVVKGEKGDKGDKGDDGKDGADGKSVFDGYATNCITEIPQDIKLELNNGTLTLKAGSKVYVPNGPGVFNVVNVSSDIRLAKNSSGLYFIFMKSNGVSPDTMPISYCYSSNSQPTITHTFAIWYDTANNKIKWTNNNGSTWVDGYSLPMCIVVNDTPGTQNVSSIDQIFNGFGYIGSAVFALPGVKGLIPNGRNADGSLRNTEFVLSKVGVRSDIIPNVSGFFALHGTVNGFIDWGFSYELTDDNYLNTSYGNKVSNVIIGLFTTDSSGKITSFNPKTTFRAIDYNDRETVVGWGMPDYSAGVSVSSGTVINEDAYIIWKCSGYGDANRFEIKVNNNTVILMEKGGYGAGGTTGSLVVTKEDTVSVTFAGVITVTKYPFKGV